MKKKISALLLIAAMFLTQSAALAAKTAIVGQTPKNPNSGVPGAGSAKLTFTASPGTGSNGAKTKVTGRTYIYAWNQSADTARTVTFDGTPDRLNRSVSITAYSLPFGEVHRFGPFTKEGWEQSAEPGYMYFEGSTSDIKFAVENLSQ